MNKKLLISIALIAIIGLVLLFNTENSVAVAISSHKSLKSHKGENKYSGYDQASACAAQCKTQWCGPYYTSRYFCCAAANQCKEQKKCVWGYCKTWQACDAYDGSFACTD